MAPLSGPETLPSLVHRAMGGDRAAFRAWLEQTHGAVFAVALRLTGQRADAEDVVQTTYVRAWQGLETLKDPGASLGWVCGIARHVSMDRRRQVGRNPVQHDEDGAARLQDHAAPSPEARAQLAEGKAHLRTALASLSADHRSVLELREMHGLAYEEVAAVLGIPVGTVESRVHRARTALARALRDLMGGDHAMP